MTEITVRLNVEDMPLMNGPVEYFAWLEKKLSEKGIPIDGDGLKSGRLHRLDDPNDFGSTVYVWKSD